MSLTPEVVVSEATTNVKMLAVATVVCATLIERDFRFFGERRTRP
jgi:hypothetical protein